MNKLFISLCISACLIGCSKKEELSPITTPVVTPTTTESTPIPTVDQKLDAMLRGHKGSAKICYNLAASGNESFFVYWQPPDKIEPDDNYMYGWWIVSEVPFYVTQANTYYIMDIPVSKYTKVFPDVTGLTCKTQ